MRKFHIEWLNREGHCVAVSDVVAIALADACKALPDILAAPAVRPFAKNIIGATILEQA